MRPRQKEGMKRISYFLYLAVFVLAVFVLEVFFSPFRGAVFGTSSTCGGEKKYAVVIDLGSSGSRTHTIEYCRMASDKMELLMDDFFEVRPGVSSYKDKLEDVKTSLSPLFEHSMRLVPSRLHASTPVIIRASAGLRLLSDDVAESILNEVRDVASKLPFLFKPEWCKVMSGEEEGAYAWMTINFALGTLGKPAEDTVGILDLGGASTQIVFAHDGDWAGIDKSRRVDMDYHDHTYSLFVKSFLGYGVFEAKRAVYEMSAVKGKGGGSVEQPCLPTGVKEKREVKSTQSTHTFVGTGKYDECLKHVRTLIDAEEPHTQNFKNSRDSCSTPSLSAGHHCSIGGEVMPKTNAHFYAFSHFFDRTNALGYDKIDTVKEMDDLAQEYCSLHIERINEKLPAGLKSPEKPGMDVREELCFDYVYMAHLWKDGYGFHQTEERVTVAEKVNNAEASWALGAFLYEGSKAGLV